MSIEDPAPSEAEVQGSITALVKLLLEVRRTTRKDLAEALDIPPTSLSHALSGQGPPRQRSWKPGEVWRLAKYFQVPVEAFFGDDEACEQVLEDLKDEALRRIEQSS